MVNMQLGAKIPRLGPQGADVTVEKLPVENVCVV